MYAASGVSRGDDIAPCFRDVAEALSRRAHQQHRVDDATCLFGMHVARQLSKHQTHTTNFSGDSNCQID